MGVGMKKTYKSPDLRKSGKLSAVTALPASSSGKVIIN